MSEINCNVSKRAHRVLDIAAAMAEKLGWPVRSQIEEMRLHFYGYAEPGCSSATGIVATGNWNTITRWDEDKKKYVTVCDLPKRIGNIFEKMGIEIEWSDEWSDCSNCYQLVRTSADSYSWQASYWMPPDAGEILCHDCVKEDPEEYLEFLDGNPDACMTIEGIDLEKHGYRKLNEDAYESGWHPGQTDDPKRIAKELQDKGVEHFIFTLDEASQFYSRFSVWVRNESTTEE